MIFVFLILWNVLLYLIGSFVAWDLLWLSGIGDLENGHRFLIFITWSLVGFMFPLVIAADSHGYGEY